MGKGKIDLWGATASESDKESKKNVALKHAPFKLCISQSKKVIIFIADDLHIVILCIIC